MVRYVCFAPPSTVGIPLTEALRAMGFDRPNLGKELEGYRALEADQETFDAHVRDRYAPALELSGEPAC